MLEALIEDGSQCVLVVDNCGADTHQKLTELLKTSGNKIGLVTVEYDVRDDLPDATRCYRLEGSSDEVIRQLLQRRYPVLSISDVDTITAFSNGNARVAFALAATVTTTGELARLRDSELFKRLFHQKNVENEDLLRCAEAASILYSFDGEDDSPGSELNKISAIALQRLPATRLPTVLDETLDGCDTGLRLTRVRAVATIFVNVQPAVDDDCGQVLTDFHRSDKIFTRQHDKYRLAQSGRKPSRRDYKKGRLTELRAEVRLFEWTHYRVPNRIPDLAAVQASNGARLESQRNGASCQFRSFE